MTRPLRLEFPGALYHVTSRGDRQGRIYCDDVDRGAWLDILAKVCARHNLVVHSFCQMTNHYHILVETADANLSQGMRHLNGLYSQYFNRRYELVGHLFQGRYKAILVQKERYLLELSRYVVLNPLRAGLVRSLEDWRWSSHHFYINGEAAPDWLQMDWLLSQFGISRIEAVRAYGRFVLAGVGEASPLQKTCHHVLLGDDAFVADYQQRQESGDLPERPRAHRRALAFSLAEYQSRYCDRDEAMAQAYLSTAFSMVQIAAHFNVSYRTVSRAVAAHEKKSQLKS
jgi:putative transposase